jgi:hypothetical protein
MLGVEAQDPFPRNVGSAGDVNADGSLAGTAFLREEHDASHRNPRHGFLYTYGE